ncbi:MAG: cytochrome c [Steroidobacteraceae bacterium]
MNRLSRIGAAATLAAVSALAFSQGGPPTPEAQNKSAIEARQGLFKLLANQNGPIGGMQRNTVPFDAAIVARNAARIQVLAGMIPELFTRDTHEFKDVKSTAMDNIWTSQADFKTKSDALVTAAGNLAEAAKGGDKATTLKAAAEVGKACGSCHDSFRAKP